MPYVIHKRSRNPATVSYSGPTCLAAGVIGGKVYDTEAEAQKDAARLSAYNPIGFEVSPIPTIFASKNTKKTH